MQFQRHVFEKWKRIKGPDMIIILSELIKMKMVPKILFWLGYNYNFVGLDLTYFR